MMYSEPIFPEFVLIFPPKLCVIIYVMQEKFHLEDHIQPKSGVFLSSRSRGGRVGVSPRKFLKNGCKWCILSPFSPSSC